MTRTRRAFLRDLGLATGGLVVAVHLPGCRTSRVDAAGELRANAFLRVTPDDRVVFTLARVEMGQGTMTSETMLVAEELGLEPHEIEVETAPNDSAYANPQFSMQITGGSNSTRTSFEQLRRAGAVLREALVGAAADGWAVPRGEVRLLGKRVVHAASAREVRIGALLVRAQDFIDEDAEPEPRSEWRLIGRSPRRLDAQAKVDGSAVFGADPAPPGLEVAVVIHGPFGATLEGFDAAAALAMKGVRAVFAIPSGVAVVADRYPRARKAAAAVVVRWSAVELSTGGVFAEYARILDAGDLDSARSDGDAGEVLAEGDVIRAEYRLPFLAHAAMEPMTATAWVQADRVEVWSPTQATLQCALVATRVTGIDAVRVHQTLLGGGFGRKSYVDVVEEAVRVSAVRKAPVRVMWSREDDIQNDFYRPASLHRLRAAVRDGKAAAWSHDIVAQSSIVTDVLADQAAEVVPRFLGGAVVWAMRTFSTDGSVVEGARELPYAIPHVEVRHHVARAPVPTGIWRSVGHSFNGFVVETFIDELATAAGADPVAFRRGLLAAQPRHLAVLDRAAAAAGWGTPLPAGRARGVAVHESFGSYAALVVEVSIERGKPRVHRVVAAVDCGLVVNPDGVVAQVEGGVVFGLSAAVTQQAITIEGGRVQQHNFYDYEALRMHECPSIEVHLIESDAPVSGIGEVAVAPAAPAVANALFLLTGVRARELPLAVSG